MSVGAFNPAFTERCLTKAKDRNNTQSHLYTLLYTLGYVGVAKGEQQYHESSERHSVFAQDRKIVVSGVEKLWKYIKYE